MAVGALIVIAVLPGRGRAGKDRPQDREEAQVSEESTTVGAV